jgi:hypothetical protein
VSETVIRVTRESLRRELARHRQEHDPATGAATCICRGWRGPYTLVADEQSYAEHLLQVIEGFDLTPFANPDCKTCEGCGRTPDDAEPCPDCIVGVWS